MRIILSDVDALMSHPVCDGCGREPHVDEKRNRTVTNIVDSDARDSSLFGTSIHLPVEITLGNGEHSVICSNSVEHFEVILNFLCQKLRHSNDTITLFGFWSGDQILPIQPLVRLIDGDSALLKIKICRGQSQKFSLSNAAPVKHLKGGYLSPDEYEKQYKNKLLELEQKLAG